MGTSDRISRIFFISIQNCSLFFFFSDISVADIWPARQVPGSNGRKKEWSARGRNTPRSFLQKNFQAPATQTISDIFQSVHSVFALIL